MSLVRNPKTGRMVLKRGKIGRAILTARSSRERSEEIDPELCGKKKCKEERICNQRTSRCVSKSGNIGRRLVRKNSRSCKDVKCSRDKICNPSSLRCVKKDGKIGSRIKWRGIRDKPRGAQSVDELVREISDDRSLMSNVHNIPSNIKYWNKDLLMEWAKHASSYEAAVNMFNTLHVRLTPEEKKMLYQTIPFRVERRENIDISEVKEFIGCTSTIDKNEDIEMFEPGKNGLSEMDIIERIRRDPFINIGIIGAKLGLDNWEKYIVPILSGIGSDDFLSFSKCMSLLTPLDIDPLFITGYGREKNITIHTLDARWFDQRVLDFPPAKGITQHFANNLHLKRWKKFMEKFGDNRIEYPPTHLPLFIGRNIGNETQWGQISVHMECYKIDHYIIPLVYFVYRVEGAFYQSQVYTFLKDYTIRDLKTIFDVSKFPPFKETIPDPALKQIISIINNKLNINLKFTEWSKRAYTYRAWAVQFPLLNGPELIEVNEYPLNPFGEEKPIITIPPEEEQRRERKSVWKGKIRSAMRENKRRNQVRRSVKRYTKLLRDILGSEEIPTETADNKIPQRIKRIITGELLYSLHAGTISDRMYDTITTDWLQWETLLNLNKILGRVVAQKREGPEIDYDLGFLERHVSPPRRTVPWNMLGASASSASSLFGYHEYPESDYEGYGEEEHDPDPYEDIDY